MPPEPMTPERASERDEEGEGHQYALAGRTSMWTRAREGLMMGWRDPLAINVEDAMWSGEP